MYDDDPDMPPLVGGGYGGGYPGAFMPPPQGPAYSQPCPGGGGMPFPQAGPGYYSSELGSSDPYDSMILTPPMNSMPLNNPAQYPSTWANQPYASTSAIGAWPPTAYEDANASQPYPAFGAGMYPSASQPNVPLTTAPPYTYASPSRRLSAPSLYQPTSTPAASPNPWPVQTQSSAFSGLALSPNLNTTASYKPLHNGRHWKLERPSEWRKDFKVRPGMSSLMRSLSFSGSGSGLPDGIPRELHSWMLYSSLNPAVSYDMRFSPSTASFAANHGRPTAMTDLTRFACEPPLFHMRLMHPYLPWYIFVTTRLNPSGITLADVLDQMHEQLMLPIQNSDFYNEEVTDSVRYDITQTFYSRTGITGDVQIGVRRVDFLRGRVVFEGLSNARSGTFEMKSRKLQS